MQLKNIFIIFTNLHINYNIPNISRIKKSITIKIATIMLFIVKQPLRHHNLLLELFMLL